MEMDIGYYCAEYWTLAAAACRGSEDMVASLLAVEMNVKIHAPLGGHAKPINKLVSGTSTYLS
jgi:hypothetical protein